MSKLSFRARALDASKPMPVFRSEEIPDLPDFAAINRAVPQMPTGMEKEEECEHHLQRAISAQQAFGHTGELVIPTPEVFSTPEDMYEQMYPANYKFPRQLIHMQPFSMDQDIPDYDMDSEDEKWLNQQAKKMDITSLQFEEMMDRLEKSSGQQVITLKEAKLLLKEDDDLIIAVYDYWLNKRLKMQLPLIPQVKTEKRDGSTNNNPYVAFRRRVEKMQTRKNRKNDEASYEKMLKLRRDLSRAVTLLEMVKRREKTKREHLHLTIEIFEKRYQVGDFSGQILAEVSAMKHTRPSFVPVNNNQVILKQDGRVPKQRNEEGAPRKKREYTKRKKQEIPSVSSSQVSCSRLDMDANYSDLLSSEDEGLSPATSPSDAEDENDPDGPYAFRRKKYCNYHAPLIERLGNWPWCSPEDGGLGDKRYRYCLTSLSHPSPRCIGFARRRIGRGGRILLDRAWTPLDDYWSDLDFTLSHSLPNGLPSSNEFLSEIKNEWLHFRPQSPQGTETECSDGNFGLTDNQSDMLDEYSRNCEQMPSDVDFESFQSHQEELFEMQRKQLEKLKQEELYAESSHNPEHSSSFQASSQFTLDSASVQFAVSAVLSASDVSGILNSWVNTPTSSSTPPIASNSLSGERTTVTNGPTELTLEASVGCSKDPSSCFGSSVGSPFVLPPSSDSLLEVSLPAGSIDSSTGVRVIPSTEQPTGNSIFFGEMGSSCTQSPCLIPVKTVSHFVNVDHRFLREQNGNQDTGSSQSSLPLTRVKVEKVAVSDTNVAMDVT